MIICDPDTFLQLIGCGFKALFLWLMFAVLVGGVTFGVLWWWMKK